MNTGECLSLSLARSISWTFYDDLMCGHCCVRCPDLFATLINIRGVWMNHAMPPVLHTSWTYSNGAVSVCLSLLDVHYYCESRPQGVTSYQ